MLKSCTWFPIMLERRTNKGEGGKNLGASIDQALNTLPQKTGPFHPRKPGQWHARNRKTFSALVIFKRRQVFSTISIVPSNT